MPLLRAFIFFIDACRLKLPAGLERSRLSQVQIFGIDGDRAARPSAAHGARHRQPDDSASNHRYARTDSGTSQIPYDGCDVICCNLGTAKAQRYASAAMAIIVDQELRSRPAGNWLAFKLEAHAALAMRPNADQIGGPAL